MRSRTPWLPVWLLPALLAVPLAAQRASPPALSVDRPIVSAGRLLPLQRPDSAVAGVRTWLSTPPDTIWPPTTRGRVAYTGPVAVLISPRTAGPAEEFLAAFQAGGRGPVFGEESAGSAGETALFALAAGW